MSVLALLRATSKIDIFDVTYERSNEKLAILDFGADAQPRKGVVVRLLSVSYWMPDSARVLLREKGPRIGTGYVLFCARSKNGRDSMGPVARRLDRAALIGPFGSARNNLSLFAAHAVGLLFIPLVVVRLLQSRGYQRASFQYIFDQYLLGYGTYFVARRWLRRTAP